MISNFAYYYKKISLDYNVHETHSRFKIYPKIYNFVFVLDLICITGYCCVVYKECAGETEAFRINTSGTDFKTPSPADIGSNCTEDFVVIDGKCLHRV